MHSRLYALNFLRQHCAVFVLILSFFVPNFSRAQAVKIISTKDGLPQSVVSGLVQDDNDFVWIATRNGLARYDGIEFKTFQHDIYNPATLASNLIIWTALDRKQNLWIEHESGEVDKLNVNTEAIEHISEKKGFKRLGINFVRRGWIVDDKERFWAIGHNGTLTCFDMSQNKLSWYSSKAATLPTDTLRGLLQDREKNVWVLTQQGLSRYVSASKGFVNFNTPIKQDYNNYFESQKEIVDLHQRLNGELIWGDRSKLFFFNPETHQFRTVAMPKANTHGVRWIRTGTDGKDYFENGGEIYEYTSKKGLKLLVKKNEDKPFDAYSFMVDRSGLIWVGTNAEGIQQISLNTPYFKSYSYKVSFHYDLLKQVLNLPTDQLFDWYTSDGPKAASSYHFRSVYDAQHNLWLALKKTVCRYNVKTRQVQKLPLIPLIRVQKDQGVGIQGITINPSGQPMVICYNGQILEFDAKTQQWLPFIDAGLIRNTFGTWLIPRDIYDDGQQLWITTDGDGLLVIDRSTKKMQQLKYRAVVGSLPTNKLLGITPDPKRSDVLWIGGYEGLICLNKKTLECEVFSLKQGLPDNTVYSIQTDSKGYLWLSTNKGLCRFNTKNKHVRVFQSTYGLPGDEFNRFHHLTMPDGCLAFGGPDGWTLFNPLNIGNDDFKPRVALTELKINNESVGWGKNGILPAPLYELNKLNLSYEQNSLMFQFAGLQYNQPKDLKYRYRLVGYDDHWVQSGNLPVANYTKIPPGTYLFKVNASNTSGEWSNYVKYLQIKITPPWWLNWPAFIVYGIIIAALIWAYTRYRVRQELLNKEVELKAVEARQLREMDEVKTRFFSNITHEFRTPLTLILGPAERIKNGQAKENEQGKLAETIETNARHLLRLINQLMDMAKLEAKAMKPREGVGSPAVTINAIIESFREQVNSNNIALDFKDHTNGSNYIFAPDMLGHTVYNLVGNAIKYTYAGGRIDIVLDAQTEGIKLTVTDTGIGIPPEKLPHIFNRFYQAEQVVDTAASNTKPEGTGIGLSLVKEMVELQNGTINAKSVDTGSTEPSGSTFIVYLPYKKAGEVDAVMQDDVVETITNELTADEDGALPLILLVEDNADLASFITTSLTDNYRVEHAWNGLQGTMMAVDLMPDLVISDVLMPVMDGLMLCKQLKDDERTSHIPVVLLTARSTFENRIEGLEQGADDYLAKPFEVTELLLRIQNMLKRQQKLKEHVRNGLAIAGDTIDANPVNVVQDAFINRLYHIIEEHLDDTQFGVDQMIDLTHMSRTSLHRKVKAIAGMSTTELLRNYRLKRASQFLQQGYNSSDAAYRTGFTSPAYFSKCFREVYNLSPLEFVKQHSEQN
ncbi:ATP-binding protein [Mucilaginibacter terrae]|uniref:histidine kinase n=1 Tax=Mucilaginibacter terrae TaxID=1955052 RepID=A0ABU3GRD1_9SPHI|nr:ATP-binding protein [Mucilaginibacter terrae]MDT3402116.1 signal transduction histidine kinase/DNA-binding response OmpR family regulator/ligand-binding sensor domain-containing protein [Mucilaginibacter terrae]